MASPESDLIRSDRGSEGSAEGGVPVIPVETREELVSLLGEAAELEHGLACSYLYAAFSLKRATDDGLTEAELEVVEPWRTTIIDVASRRWNNRAPTAAPSSARSILLPRALSCGERDGSDVVVNVDEHVDVAARRVVAAGDGAEDAQVVSSRADGGLDDRPPSTAQLTSDPRVRESELAVRRRGVLVCRGGDRNALRPVDGEASMRGH